MEGKLQYQGQLDKYLEEWLYPRGIKPKQGFFSEEEKQESTRTEVFTQKEQQWSTNINRE